MGEINRDVIDGCMHPMTLTAFLANAPSLAMVEERLHATRSALYEAKAGPAADSYLERHRIAALADDICALESRLQSMEINMKRVGQA